MLRPNKGLVKALEATPLSIFKPIADLGYFGWKPKGPYKDLAMVTVADIQDSFDIHMTPPAIVPVEQLSRDLPLPFENLPPRRVIKAYPLGAPDIAGLHAAVRHRGVDMSKVNFFFGGTSTLEMLATRRIDKNYSYFATLIPGTETIMITSQKDYLLDMASINFQFRNFAIGKKFGDEIDRAEVNHLQLVEVGEHLVLFSTEVSAMNSNNDPVKLASRIRRNWGTQMLYQMISTGSFTLYSGSRQRSSLIKVAEHSLPYVAETTLKGVDIDEDESNILNAMSHLVKKHKSDNGYDGGKQAYEISFDGRNVVMTPCPSENICVPEAVLRILIH